MLTVMSVISTSSSILSIILMIIMYFIGHCLIAKEDTRWRNYKLSNIIVESFEMYDKGLLSADKDIERIKHDYKEQYKAYEEHKRFKDELINFVVKSGIFSFLSLLLSVLTHMIKCAMM